MQISTNLEAPHIKNGSFLPVVSTIFLIMLFATSSICSTNSMTIEKTKNLNLPTPRSFIISFEQFLWR